MRFFVTGTGTGVGKTTFSVRLLQHFTQRKKRTLGLKPVASGCAPTPQGLRNQDALLLQSASSITVDYATVNPMAFGPPIAPHIAAQAVQSRLCAQTLAQHCQDAINTHAPDVAVIEGAGGFLVPLNDAETFGDLAQALGYPVVLVVAIELGCLNHALLSWQAIHSSGVPFAGWVANCIQQDMPYQKENIATLTQWLKVPPMMSLPFISDCLARG